MDDAVIQLARQLLDGGFTRLSDREQRVITHIAKRLHIARDVNALHEENQTFGDRLADKVARFGGSWTFIVTFTGMLLAWVVLNTVILARYSGGFDPYPYIFLNLILSMVAALQAPVILMSQNRQAARDRLATSSHFGFLGLGWGRLKRWSAGRARWRPSEGQGFQELGPRGEHNIGAQGLQVVEEAGSGSKRLAGVPPSA
jgi:hypothetical protein